MKISQARPIVASLLFAAACSPGVEAPRLAVTVESSGTTARLQAVFAVDEEVVWASGLEGTWAVTTDGGATWRAAVVPEAEGLQFRDVHAFDAQTAFLLAAGEGEASRIYATTDGGASWSLRFVNLEPRGFLDCFDFWDRDNGLVYGDSVAGELFVLITGDGGMTWDRLPSASLPPAAPGEGGFAASGTCVALAGERQVWIGTGAGGAGRVLRSGDRGRSWASAETPIVRGESAGITSVVVANERLAFAFGGDLERPGERTVNVARTRDGGASWRPGGELPFDGAAYGGAWSSRGQRSLLVAAGPAGLAVSTDLGDSWTLASESPLWAVDFADADTFWGVGPEGAILRFDLVD